MQRQIKKKPTFTLDQLLKGRENPLTAKFCSRYGYYFSTVDKQQECSAFCSEYISDKRTPQHTLEIKLRKTEEYHCGYCSDNDGSITEETTEETVFFKLPDGYELKECKSLFQDFYMETCYCGKNNINYCVFSIN